MYKINLRVALSSLAAISLGSVAAQAQTAPLYHLVRIVPLGGGIKWDYLHFDAPSERLYISHGTEVTVVNTKTDAVLGELAGTLGSHGIAVDPATGDVYADSAAKRLAFAFNPKSFAPLASVPVVLDPDGMAYDPASKQIFVAGGDGNAITPIDPATHKAASDIALGGAPEFLATDGAGSLYVNIEDKNELVRIDTATDKITARWPLDGCQHPKGLAIDSMARLVFSSCSNGAMDVLNADTGTLVATLLIGKGTDAAAFDPVRHRAFSSNGDGTLSVVSDAAPGNPVLLGTVKTAPGARTMTVDPATGRIFLVTAKVSKIIPAATPEDHPHDQFVPGSLKLLVYAPGS
jgi:DNA-binding beta-propeller fold protein YncE